MKWVAFPLALVAYAVWDWPRSLLTARAARRRLREAPRFIPLGLH